MAEPDTDPKPTSGPEAPEPVELRIERLSPGGDGVGREPSGRVVFVPLTAPGDRVLVRIVDDRARFARAEIVRVIEPGERVEPPCAVFGECGGCAWQHVPYEAQLAQKADFIADALRRIGHLDLDGAVPVEPCPSAYGYRIRSRVAVEGRRAGFRRRRSHALCATEHCPVLAPELEAVLPTLPRRARGRFGDWWLAAGDDGQVEAMPVAGQRGRPPRIARRVFGQRFECALGGFSQANGPLFERVAEETVAAAGRGGTVLELFAGAGYLTLGLAAGFSRVLAVEGDRRSLRDLESNLAAAELAQVEVLASSVEAALESASVREAAPEVVVLDPPRTGLPAGSAEPLAELHAPRLVYLSCDPATLARDAGALAGLGYVLTRARGFDLFPQTPHVEALAVFTRASAETDR